MLLSRQGKPRPKGPVAPGNRSTLLALRDPSKRPAEAWDPIPADVLDFQPGSPLEMDVDGFTKHSLCEAWVAGGPSGMTADHRLILESEADTTEVGRMATDLAAISCDWCHLPVEMG